MFLSAALLDFRTTLLKSLPFRSYLDALPFSSDGLLEWYYKAAIKQTKLFFATGHFLLLNPSSAEKDAGICKSHLTSPVLPGSDKHCVFQLALYEAAPAAGNLTLLVKAVLSGSTVHSLSLNHTSHDDHRLAHTERALMLL